MLEKQAETTVTNMKNHNEAKTGTDPTAIRAVWGRVFTEADQKASMLLSSTGPDGPDGHVISSVNT